MSGTHRFISRATSAQAGRTRPGAGWPSANAAAFGSAFLHLFGYLDDWLWGLGGRLLAWRHRCTRLMAAVYCAATLLAGCAVAPRPQLSVGGSQLALTAIGLVGTPYRYGGDDPRSGLDCSGLVRFAASIALGIELPRQAETMSRFGAEVAEGQLQSGDLVFFDTLGRPFSHVGVYLGDDRFVHAPTERGFVRIEQFSRPYWRTRFNGARRLGPMNETGLPPASTAATTVPETPRDRFAVPRP